MGMPIVQSILDTDFYILPMCDAALQLCPNVEAEYMFVDRNNLIYDDYFLKRVKTAVRDMGMLQLRDQEHAFLKEKATFLSRGFLEYLRNLRLDPDAVDPTLDSEGHLKITIKGPLIREIWWEVPLMATISELYFADSFGRKDNGWNYDGQSEKAKNKAQTLSIAGCQWADFGTRRRRSFHAQKLVVEAMKGYKGFRGTSNPYLSMLLDVGFIGTQAHQWIQIWSALMGLRHANKFAMEAWVKAFRGDLGIALTDTFGTDAFFADFDLYFAKLFDGVRHDSGDPFTFATKVVAHYRKLGINTRTKVIVFSDSLNPALAVEIQKHCNNLDINCSFGIGTNFTNDFDGMLKALNIVIKLIALDGIQVVKLSDVPTKAVCGDSEAGRTALRIAKNMFLGEAV